MKSDSEQFLEAVEHYCKGFTVAPGCRGIQCEYAEGDDNHQCEPHFSWAQCDSCGSRLGGDREKASMIALERNHNGELDVIDCEICVDCVMFWANGDIPKIWS